MTTMTVKRLRVLRSCVEANVWKLERDATRNRASLLPEAAAEAVELAATLTSALAAVMERFPEQAKQLDQQG